MLLETCQMLSTAVQKYTERLDDLYKPAYPKHPSTIWAGINKSKFCLVIEHGNEINFQYQKRFKKNISLQELLTSYIDKGYDKEIPKVIQER